MYPKQPNRSHLEPLGSGLTAQTAQAGRPPSFMNISPEQDKSALRKRLRALRAAVPPTARKRAGIALVRLALGQRLLHRKSRVGFYIPAKGEIDVLPLLDRALGLGLDCYLPIVPGRGRRKLWFTRLGDHPAWRMNRYGIPEYHHSATRRVRAQHLDLLFMPLLGFDGRGFRIGMGGGYYDASLGFLRRRRHWRKPRLVGVAFAAQQVVRVPNDPWDVALQGILTERGYLPVATGQSALDK